MCGGQKTVGKARLTSARPEDRDTGAPGNCDQESKASTCHAANICRTAFSAKLASSTKLSAEIRNIRRTETEQRRQQQDIFAVEDEIEARRDALIDALQKRLHRASRNQSLFVVRWCVV